MKATASPSTESRADQRRAPRVSPAERIRFGLRFKIIVALTIFNVLGTAVFAWNYYRIEKASTIEGIELKLAAAARALPDMLPEGYLDRATNADAIDPTEYATVMKKLSAYTRDVGLIYLYSYAVQDGVFRTTSSNATREEWDEGTYARYWEEYDEPLLREAWATDRPMYGETSEDDQWGKVYFVFSPARTDGGTRYIVGADIAIAQLYAKLDESLRRSMFWGFISFVLVFLFSFWIGTRFSRKITHLSSYTRELAAADFQPVQDHVLRKHVVRIPSESRDEIAQLASSFITMEARLNTYLRELTDTTAAKERLRNELKIAGEIQLSMLPREFAAMSRTRGSIAVDLHATVKPAKEAGGDLYDFFFLDDEHLCFMVGDVSDKGMPAALFMTVVITVMRARVQSALALAPHTILAQANELLVDQNSMCQFVTLFMGILDVRTGLVTYSNGGHNKPYLCRAGYAPAKLPADDGIALGIMSGAEFMAQTVQLAPGDTLYLYSDGVTEAVASDGSFFGEQRLEGTLTALAGNTHASATSWVEETLHEVLEFSNDLHQADDITILALRIPR